jgi:hypothetical protein
LHGRGDGANALDVAFFSAAAGQAVENLQHLIAADPAGGAFSAGLVNAEAEVEPRHFHHRIVLVHHDHAAGAHDRAKLLQAFVADLRVEQVLGNHAAGRAAGLHGLDGLAAEDAATEVEDDIAQGDAERNLDELGMPHLAGDGEDLRAAGFLHAELGVPRSAPHKNGRHGRQRLDVIDGGGLAEEAALGWIRRPRAGAAALALDRGDERSLLAADECAGAEADLGVEGKTGAEDVVTQEAGGPRVYDGFLHSAHGERILGADVEVAAGGANRVGRDDQALEHAVRIAFQHAAIHVGAGVAFVAVADDVLGRALNGARDLPLEPGGEAGAAAAAQAAGFHFGDDVLRLHAAEDAHQALVDTVAQAVLKVFRVEFAAITHDDPHLFVGFLVEQVVDDFLALHAGLDDAGHIGRQDIGIGDARRQELHGHPLVINPHVERAHHLHLVLQVAALEFLREGELEELGLVALFGAGVLDQDVRAGAVEGQGAVAPRQNVVVEQPAAGQVVLEDLVGNRIVDAAVNHAGHALAGDLDERIGKGVAETADVADFDRESQGADALFKDGADRVGSGRDPAGVDAHPHPVWARVGHGFRVFLQIGKSELVHDAALGWVVWLTMRDTSEAFSRP